MKRCKWKGVKILLLALMVGFMCIVSASSAYANEITPLEPTQLPIPSISINLGGPDATGQTATNLQLLFLLVIISLIPYILIMTTCFTRLIIVLHFLRSALGTQQMPPNQVMIGIALFLTFFMMGPAITEINANAVEPLVAGQITQQQAIEEGMKPLRNFMIRQVEDKDIALFAGLAGETYATVDDIPYRVIIPAFILGELSKGFIIGFILYIPFIVIDMVVASTLMAMGMMMLPPAMISLPFKILLFVLVDGWDLVIGNVMRTFR